MPELRIRASGECVSLAEYQARHPNVTFAPDFEPIDGDADFVGATSPPKAGPGRCAMRAGAELKDGAWVQAWTIRDMTPEELTAREQAARDAARLARTSAIAHLKVMTASGRRFDADEVSQGRMARAIQAMQIGHLPLMNWTLADNNEAEVSLEELGEALRLAVLSQTASWTLPGG